LHPFDSSTAKQEDGRSSPVVPRLNLQGDTFLTSLPQLDFGQSSVAERDNLNSTQQLQQQHTSPEGSVRSQAVVDRGEADETEETLVWADSLYDEVAPVGLIDVPSASAEPSNSAVVDATTGTSPSALFPSGAEVDAAHQSTKKLLTRMAQRLDLVCPSGYGEMSFSKKLVKLYRTPQGETTANTAQQQESNAMIVLGASGDGQEQTLGETLSPAPPPQMEEEEGPEDWDEYAERFLAALRTPETAKNVAEMHDRIRQYKRSREVGGGGRQVANWITRVSSQLKVENLQISAPSLIAKTTTTKFSFPATARAPRQGPSSPRETHDRVLLTARK
jgi:hypothetical protein